MTKKVKTLSTNLGDESNKKQCQLTEHPLGVHVSELMQIRMLKRGVLDDLLLILAARGRVKEERRMLRHDAL